MIFAARGFRKSWPLGTTSEWLETDLSTVVGPRSNLTRFAVRGVLGALGDLGRESEDCLLGCCGRVVVGVVGEPDGGVDVNSCIVGGGLFTFAGLEMSSGIVVVVSL